MSRAVDIRIYLRNVVTVPLKCRLAMGGITQRNNMWRVYPFKRPFWADLLNLCIVIGRSLDSIEVLVGQHLLPGLILERLLWPGWNFSRILLFSSRITSVWQNASYPFGIIYSVAANPLFTFQLSIFLDDYC